MLRVPLAELAEGERVLPADAARYVMRVHRLRNGEAFVAFDPEARMEADAEILESGRRVRIRLGWPRAATVVAIRSVTILQAAARKLDQVVRDATELGATRVVVMKTARASSSGGRASRWRRIAVEAARQAGRGDAPEISGPLPFDDALALATDGSRVCLHPAAEQTLAHALADFDAGVTIAIGPEGGFTEEELEVARAAGFALARLGRFVMRSETACAAALGALAALSDR
jgi:16S rRNA (uracil1498-N3)-methyltransferase